MKKSFLTGLVLLLPLAVTLWVARFFVHLLTDPFIDFVTPLVSRLPAKGFFSSPEVIKILSQLLILIALFAFTLLLGVLARRIFIAQCLRLGDWILGRIPLINKVYKTCKEVIQALFKENSRSFQQVVLFSFPHPDSYCLGMISNENLQTHSDKETGETRVAIFIPTTPNPATGFLVMRDKKELIYLKMTCEEAIKYVVSCGVIQPRGQQLSETS